MLEEYEAARELWVKALADSAETRAAQAEEGDVVRGDESAEGDRQFNETVKQNIYDFSKTFDLQIEDYKNGKFPRNDTLIVCETPEIFRKIGLNTLPMTYTQGHLKDALANKDGDHLGETLLKKLPQALEHPLAIIDSTSKPGRIVAIIEIKG